MEYAHSQEIVIDTFDYNGIDVDLVSWSDTIWCGKIGYAVNNIDEPDVEKIAQEASIIFPNSIPNRREKNWEVCISLNYLSKERPNGVMFGFLVETEEQPDCYDVIKVPSSLYMKIQICDKTFKALDVEPWTGGIPPYEWIGEILAPRYGYEYGDDTLPVYEYYLHNPENLNIEACYLYVPVREKSKNIMSIETARLILRRFTTDDWQDLLEIARSKEVSPYAYTDYPWPTTEDWAKESAAYMATDSNVWAIACKEDGKVICFVNCNGMNDMNFMDIGHVMNMAYAGHGYEEEGLSALYSYVFKTTGAVGITAAWALEDKAKITPLLSMGMEIVYTDTAKAFDCSDRTFTSCVLQITAEQWKTQISKEETA